MSDHATATASVVTATPERYAKQLASHLSRRSEIREDPESRTIVLTDGECELRPHDDRLDLHVRAATEGAVDRITDVVGSHLERFGQRNELHVEWERPGIPR
jgi:hypothetical protein